MLKTMAILAVLLLSLGATAQSKGLPNTTKKVQAKISRAKPVPKVKSNTMAERMKKNPNMKM